MISLDAVIGQFIKNIGAVLVSSIGIGILAMLGLVIFLRGEPALFRAELTSIPSSDWEAIVSGASDRLPAHFRSTLGTQYEFVLSSTVLAEKLANNAEALELLCGRQVSDIAAVSDSNCAVPRPLRSQATQHLSGLYWVKMQLSHTVRIASIGKADDAFLRRLIVLGPTPELTERLAEILHDLCSEILRARLFDSMEKLSNQLETKIALEKNVKIRRALSQDRRLIEIAQELISDSSRGLLLTLSSPHSRQIWPPAFVAVITVAIATFCMVIAMWGLWFSLRQKLSNSSSGQTDF